MIGLAQLTPQERVLLAQYLAVKAGHPSNASALVQMVLERLNSGNYGNLAEVLSELIPNGIPLGTDFSAYLPYTVPNTPAPPASTPAPYSPPGSSGSSSSTDSGGVQPRGIVFPQRAPTPADPTRKPDARPAGGQPSAPVAAPAAGASGPIATPLYTGPTTIRPESHTFRVNEEQAAAAIRPIAAQQNPLAWFATAEQIVNDPQFAEALAEKGAAYDPATHTLTVSDLSVMKDMPPGLEAALSPIPEKGTYAPGVASLVVSPPANGQRKAAPQPAPPSAPGTAPKVGAANDFAAGSTVPPPAAPQPAPRPAGRDAAPSGMGGFLGSVVNSARGVLDSLFGNDAAPAPHPEVQPMGYVKDQSTLDAAPSNAPVPATLSIARMAVANALPEDILRLSPYDIELLARAVSTEVDPRIANTDLNAYQLQVQRVLDVMLNRLGSGEFGGSTSAMLNQRNQFSAINGPKDRGYRVYGSAENIPAENASDDLRREVNAWIRAREAGVPSSVGGALHYANPAFVDESNKTWVAGLNNAVDNAGNMSHRYGTAPGHNPFEANLYRDKADGNSLRMQPRPGPAPLTSVTADKNAGKIAPITVQRPDSTFQTLFNAAIQSAAAQRQQEQAAAAAAVKINQPVAINPGNDSGPFNYDKNTAKAANSTPTGSYASYSAAEAFTPTMPDPVPKVTKSQTTNTSKNAPSYTSGAGKTSNTSTSSSKKSGKN